MGPEMPTKQNFNYYHNLSEGFCVYLLTFQLVLPVFFRTYAQIKDERNSSSRPSDFSSCFLYERSSPRDR